MLAAATVAVNTVARWEKYLLAEILHMWRGGG